jgi:hypothetical protein
MIHRTLGHRAFEALEDAPPADPMQEPLQAIERLQTLRRLAADADVAMARQALAQAQGTVSAMSESLAAHVRQLQDERAAKAGERMARPADIAALNRWRREDFDSIAGIERHQDELAAERQRSVQAQEDLEARIARRRAVVIRCEKYAALLQRITEA